MLTLPETFDILAVAVQIGVPAEEWRGNCYGIASLFLKKGVVTNAKLRYGLWMGPVAKGSVMYGRPPEGMHHGWLENPDGTIIDPTRFEFEQKPPYVYVGISDYYDAGGNKLRLKELRFNPPPPFSDTQKNISLKLETPEAKEFVTSYLQHKINGETVVLSARQAFWLANLPLDFLADNAKEVFNALIKSGNGGLIPWDNRKMVLEE
ncbi:Uncharacterised protein [uncultured archaeon]|nr:Uncharacterised protein [uncultured archaeon]